MHRIDGPTAAPGGFFTEGDPTGGVAATIVSDDWMNDVQENIIAVLTAAQMAPTKGRAADLLDSMRALFPGISGASRNLAANLAAANTGVTVTAKELIVIENSTGRSYRLVDYSQGVNLLNVGKGGINSGVAPASGSVALYAIFNPTTKDASILAIDVSGSVPAPTFIYNDLPAGYTASAFISLLKTNSSRQLIPFLQIEREVFIADQPALSTTAIPSTPTANTSALIPFGAKSISGSLSVQSTNASNLQMTVAGNPQNAGKFANTGAVLAGNTQQVPYYGLPLQTPQTFYYTMASSAAGTSTAVLSFSSYKF